MEQLAAFVSSKDGIADKSRLSFAVQQEFSLTKDRSVFYCEWFAIRFCSAASKNFSNTVLALSVLHKYDAIPFIVCLVTPCQNYLMLANATFLKKISHSSQELRRDNIKGSFNGSDIMRDFEGVKIVPRTLNSYSVLTKITRSRKILRDWWKRQIILRRQESAFPLPNHSFSVFEIPLIGQFLFCTPMNSVF